MTSGTVDEPPLLPTLLTGTVHHHLAAATMITRLKPRSGLPTAEQHS